ncbi:MAG: TrkH family potassium uptake protein [Firmicutes bacterium]|nr:TrkH family potassium uptake protein [Bacillota bacterium]
MASFKRVNPPLLMIFGFALIILLGAVLLALPGAAAGGENISFLDALFTSASAVSVTGLTVIDTGSSYSLFGQIIILVLIQLGGLGFTTFAVSTAVLLGKKIGLKQRLLIRESTHAISNAGMVRLSLAVLLITTVVEGVATVILAVRWYGELGWKSVYYALFHSISSFNNAGISLWPDNLLRYMGDPVVNLDISGLFIIGGIGFMVIIDLYIKRDWTHLSLNSKISLTTSLLLCAAGFFFVYFLESFNPDTLGGLSTGQKMWAAYFQGVAPRSSGLSTIDITHMLAATQLVIIILMFIGSSSGSTGGGIKTGTFAILVLSFIAIIRGKTEVSVFRRTVTADLILRALAVILSSMMVVLIATLLLAFTEHTMQGDFLDVLFEVVSAFGTVGLSLGLTVKLSVWGKIVIILTMFIGRLGPLTMAFALAQRSIKPSVRYAEEKIMIG